MTASVAPVSGFSIVRNAIQFGYPVAESLRSLAPLVDELIVAVGRSEDGTLDLVRSLDIPHLRVVETVWDQSLRVGGRVLAQQTNLALSHCTGDWAFYLQADEVVHEDDHARIIETMARYLPDRRILALTFRYLHFFGDYHSVNPWGYHGEIRVIRNNGRLESAGDASGFRCTGNGLRPGNPRKQQRRDSGGTIYHYGYVKDSTVMLSKLQAQVARYYGGHPPESREALESFYIQGLTPGEQTGLFQLERFPYDLFYDSMKEFHGTHPRVMSTRVGRTPRLRPRYNRWFNWRFYREIIRHGFRLRG